VDLTRFDSADALLDAAGDFLAEREAEHNLPLGILITLRDQPGVYREAPYLGVVRDAGAVALVVVQTPPRGLILSEPGVATERIAATVLAVVGDLATVSPDLTGVSGPKSTVEPFVAAWSSATGRPARLAMAERIYRLSRVIPPPPVPGTWRFADVRDRAFLLEWFTAFRDEAMSVEPTAGEAEAMVDLWVRRDGRDAYLWEVGGRVVSLVVAGARTPNGRRIGPVYTPPGERRRGYATALTAVASQDQLDRGSRFCFLFTNLANETANAIYRRIGYQPVTDIDRYAFGAGE
jgi:predicted GNAT family acetyltransferase